MKRKINLTISLIVILGIFQSGCSQQSDSITTTTISINNSNYIVRDSVKISPALKFNLSLDKEKYYIGNIVILSFRINGPIYFDAPIVPKLIIPNQEKLGVEIYKDSTLVFKYPKEQIEINPDTLLLPTILYYNWNQVDNDSNQVEVGEYLIKTYLLHESYYKFIKQKKFLIYK
jgi:hypothetical protein